MNFQLILRQKDNDQLISDLKSLLTQERKLLTQIIDHLKEVERRKLYLKKGYSSLFSWMTEFLGYSEGAAQRRIQAMRLVRDLPEVEEKISSGKLSLSVASQLQGYLRREDQKRKELRSERLTKVKKLDLVSKLEGTSSRECEQALAKISPELALPREKTRPITEEKTQISFVAGKDLIQKINRLKSLTSHQNPEGSYEKLFEKALNIALEKLDPVERQKRRKNQEQQKVQKASPINGKQKPTEGRKKLPNPRSVPPPGTGRCRAPTSKVNRHIPKPLQDQIWERDHGECQYLDQRTGKKCGSRHLIQMEHKYPFSWGGEHSLRNLRLYCSFHNLSRME